MATENPINLGQIATLVNRTSRVLMYIVDGRRYELQPGPNQVLDFHIRFAAEQNIIPGSGDPLVPSRYETMVGVPGASDCSELPDEYLDALPHERLDRSLMDRKHQHVVERRISERDMPRRRVGMEQPTEGFTAPSVQHFQR
jgi:hypothetical protein